MKQKELNHNLEKIKQLLNHSDYDKIDVGINLAAGMDEPKIFETLLEGSYFGKYSGKSYLRLNDFQKNNNINIYLDENNVSIIEKNKFPTGYYILLSLILNDPSTDLNEIKNLDLSLCDLERLPEKFSNCLNLEKLNLESNNFKDFPNEILKLKNLTHLFLGWNKIKKLPDGLNALNNLECLKIGDNYIETIPESISDLKKLTELDIGGNALDTFPIAINRLTSLKNINFVEYNGDNETFDEDGSINNDLLKNNPKIKIEQPVNCFSCETDKSRLENMIERYDGYFCESCDADWNENYYTCECCEQNVANYTAGPYYDYGEVKEKHNSYTIKIKNSSFIKIICPYCVENIPSQFCCEEVEDV